MPELAEMETPKTAGFVDRGYNHSKRKQRMEDEAKEIAELEAQQRGESTEDTEQEVFGVSISASSGILFSLCWGQP